MTFINYQCRITIYQLSYKECPISNNQFIFFLKLNRNAIQMKENIIEKKSFDFAIEIVATYKYLTFEQREFILSKQLLRSGTSIGANITEAIGGQSSKDFIHKLKISRKETNETLYWLKLLEATNYLKVELATNMIKSCMELLKILTAIIKTMEAKLK